MKPGIKRDVLWSVAMGLALGWLASILEFIITGADRIKRDINQAVLSLIYISAYYSVLWMILLLCLGLTIIALSLLTRKRQKFNERFLHLSSHLLAAGIAIFIFIYYLLAINYVFLPTALELKSITGNLFFLALCMLLSLPLYFLFRNIYVRIRGTAIYSMLKYTVIFLASISLMNILLAATVSTRQWLLATEKIALEAESTPKDINIVLITIDALRPDHLSCYGYNRPTPTINSLANSSTKFSRAISQSSWTYFSFTSMMTSMYPMAISNCEQVALDPKRVTLAEILSANGFKTAAILSNPFLKKQWNIVQGFEYVSHSDQTPLPQDMVGSKVYAIISRLNSKLFLKEDAETLTTRAIEWLKNNSLKKFFLWIHYMEPHLPYGDPWNDLWPQDPDYHGKIGDRFGDWIPYHERRARMNHADLQHLKYLYDGDIHYVDFHLKKLFDYLKQNNLWESSLIILTSDHGEEFMEHGDLHHGTSVHDELVHVPLLIRLPGQNSGKFIDSQVRLLDLAPTMLEAAGLKPGREMQGRSLIPLINGEKIIPEPAFSACNYYGDKAVSIRYDSYTLIYNEQDQSLKLFDRKTDPIESRDIHEEERQATQKLKDILDDHRDKNIALFENLENIWAMKKLEISEADKQRLRALGYIR